MEGTSAAEAARTLPLYRSGETAAPPKDKKGLPGFSPRGLARFLSKGKRGKCCSLHLTFLGMTYATRSVRHIAFLCVSYAPGIVLACSRQTEKYSQVGNQQSVQVPAYQLRVDKTDLN